VRTSPPSEEISLRHLNHFLGKYDKCLLVPESLDFALPGLITMHFQAMNTF